MKGITLTTKLSVGQTSIKIHFSNIIQSDTYGMLTILAFNQKIVEIRPEIKFLCGKASYRISLQLCIKEKVASPRVMKIIVSLHWQFIQ